MLLRGDQRTSIDILIGTFVAQLDSEQRYFYDSFVAFFYTRFLHDLAGQHLKSNAYRFNHELSGRR